MPLARRVGGAGRLNVRACGGRSMRLVNTVPRLDEAGAQASAFMPHARC